MKIDEFVKKYDNANNERKLNVIDEVIIKDKYVPYAEKITICNNIIESTMFNPKNKKELYVNSNMRHFLLMLNFIKLYTTIEINFEDSNIDEQYDLLNKNGKIALIYEAIDKKETLEFNFILENAISDFMENNRSISSIHNKVDKSITEFINSLKNEITNVSTIEKAEVTDEKK